MWTPGRLAVARAKASANGDPNKEQKIIVLLYTLNLTSDREERTEREERESIFRTQKLDK